MRIIKNTEPLERKFDSKYTYKNFEEVEKRAKQQSELIEKRMEELNKELEELSYLSIEYETMEMGAKEHKEIIKEEVELIGGNIEGGVKEIRKAMEEYEELECYIGVVEKMYYAGAIIGERPEIVLERYRKPEGVKIGDINNYEKVSILELNEFVNEFYN